MDPEKNVEGRAILNEIMSISEEFRDSLTIILAGYKDDIETKLISFNPRMASRFTSVHFNDFNIDELQEIWMKYCKDMDYECSDQVSIVATRRLGRGIGSKCKFK